jgi:Fe-S oxidoreductase
MSEYLANLVQNGMLSLKNLDLSCVYHDPCTLARKLAVTAPPRAVLAAIPGVRVVEPFLAREQTQCCGSGGGLSHVFPETAATIARTRTADLLGDADTIVTACPTCKAAFVRQGGGALDLVEVVARSLEGNDG